MFDGAAQGPGVVLLVDDVPENRDVFRFNFEDEFEVHTAGSGPEALAILDELDADAVVADHRMPGMSGLDLLERVRGRCEDVGRILVTGHTNEELLLEAIQRQVLHHFIPKPWSYERVVGVLGAAVARRRLAQRADSLERQVGEAAHFATLGELAAGLIHDLSQPLQVVDAGLAVAADMLTQSPEAILADLTDLRGCITDAALAVGHLRKLAVTIRGLMHRRPVQLEPIGLDAVIDDALVLLRPRLRRCDAELDLRLPEPVPEVMGDRLQLLQVLLNLVGNACDVLSGRETRKVTICVVPRPDGSQRLEVADTGPGIAEELRDRVFEPFFTTKPASRGTGLGLAIVRRIARAHHGRIDVAAHRGGGACFRVHLPSPAAVVEELTLTTGRPAPIDPFSSVPSMTAVSGDPA